MILSRMLKVFERLLYKQIFNFAASKFSPHLCGFRKNHNSQQSLSKISEVCKKYLEKGDLIDVLLTDLSKAFNATNHSLLLAYRF